MARTCWILPKIGRRLCVCLLVIAGLGVVGLLPLALLTAQGLAGPMSGQAAVKGVCAAPLWMRQSGPISVLTASDGAARLASDLGNAGRGKAVDKMDKDACAQPGSCIRPGELPQCLLAFSGRGRHHVNKHLLASSPWHSRSPMARPRSAPILDPTCATGVAASMATNGRSSCPGFSVVVPKIGRQQRHGCFHMPDSAAPAASQASPGLSTVKAIRCPNPRPAIAVR